MQYTSYRGFSLKNARAQHDSFAVVVQRNRKGKDVPDPLLAALRQIQQPAEGAVDVGFAGICDGADDLFPIGGKFWRLLKHIAAGEPAAWFAEQSRAGVVDVLPVAVAVENFEHDVTAHGHVDT